MQLTIFNEGTHPLADGPEAADDQLLVNTLAESVRTRIQEMIMDALRARRSVWFG